MSSEPAEIAGEPTTREAFPRSGLLFAGHWDDEALAEALRNDQTAPDPREERAED